MFISFDWFPFRLEENSTISLYKPSKYWWICVCFDNINCQRISNVDFQWLSYLSFHRIPVCLRKQLHAQPEKTESGPDFSKKARLWILEFIHCLEPCRLEWLLLYRKPGGFNEVICTTLRLDCSNRIIASHRHKSFRITYIVCLYVCLYLRMHGCMHAGTYVCTLARSSFAQQ